MRVLACGAAIAGMPAPPNKGNCNHFRDRDGNDKSRGSVHDATIGYGRDETNGTELVPPIQAGHEPTQRVLERSELNARLSDQTSSHA